MKPILNQPTAAANNNNSKQKKKSLKWDEDNLHKTELLKCSTMKITEPKTPYVYSYELSDNDSTIEEIKLPQNQILSSENNHYQEEEVGNMQVDLEALNVVDHDKFNQIRQKHYKMKDAIKKGKELLQNELNNNPSKKNK